MKPGDVVLNPDECQECVWCRRNNKPLRMCASVGCGLLTCDECSYECPGCHQGPICTYRYTCSCGLNYCYDIHSHCMRTCTHFHKGGGGSCGKSTCPICDVHRLRIDRCSTCGNWRCVGSETVHSCDDRALTADQIQEEEERSAKLEKEIRKGLLK